MKKTPALAAILLTAGLALTACSDPGAGGSASGGAPAEWPAQDADLSGVELTIWAAQNSNTVPDAVVEAFEETTGASVDVVTITDPYEQSIQTKIATGDKPDLAFWQPTASMLAGINAKQNLQPLDDAPWLDDMDPALVDLTGSYDGTRYAALISTPAVIGAYYNKQVFADAGLTDTPTSWTELVEDARTVQAAGVTPFFEMGGNAGSPWGTQWWVQAPLAEASKDGLWEDVNSASTTFGDSPIIDAITGYQDLIAEGLFNDDIKTATFEDQGAALLAGDAAMVMQVNSFFGQLQSLADTDELNEKIGFFPISTDGNVGTFVPDQANALVAFRTGDESREAAARQLLSFWLGDGYADFVEDQDTVSLQPGVETPATVPDALVSVADALDGAAGSMQVEAVANPDLYLRLGDMIQGALTPEQVAQQTQDQFAQLASAQGVEGF
ncbi:ABC transporter substrate-binding protein [Cellulomonas sp. PS-H5]|uniref:ABC transporter substrate-binding protein n=1 Tax=Cellulomonas sp. PS-H5 TaxID=2820400 RepID=UPI001C4FB0F6|nr:ABC transporter substrate-binding protein [Cellulomonas sp. PS-H5]MBW0253141.1 ABC transporter substrate-binding protein [Cellulomonas sp. PS-H5]